MADSTRFKLDASEWDKAFNALGGVIRESLARRMLVEGGVMLRDAAASNARVAANKEGNETRGLLASAMRLVRTPEEENEHIFAYKVSWNSKIAPHGHLIEFGHWMTHKVYKASNGEWYTLKDQPLDAPRWVAARPFLRPTWDSYAHVAIRVMIQRGQKEVPILLREYATT
jgi:hypothetical protein